MLLENLEIDRSGTRDENTAHIHRIRGMPFSEALKTVGSVAAFAAVLSLVTYFQRAKDTVVPSAVSPDDGSPKTRKTLLPKVPAVLEPNNTNDAQALEDLPVNPLQKEQEHLLTLLSLKPEGSPFTGPEENAIVLAMQALEERAKTAAESALPLSAPPAVPQYFTSAIRAMIRAEGVIGEKQNKVTAANCLNAMFEHSSSVLLSNASRINPRLQRKPDGKSWLVGEGDGEWKDVDAWLRQYAESGK